MTPQAPPERSCEAERSSGGGIPSAARRSAAARRRDAAHPRPQPASVPHALHHLGSAPPPRRRHLRLRLCS
jgi:hypothetical protein